jgi:predicted nicotinamide N-methyase
VVESLNLIRERLDIDGLSLSILRPQQADALLSEEAFEHEEFLPYWAELWPSGLALARVVRRRDVRDLRILELGCGLAVPSIVAALGGAHVLATDWSPEALEVAAANADRNGAAVETELVSWADSDRLVRGSPWDLVLGADLLYEQRNVDQLLGLLPRLGGEILVAEPGRPPSVRFFEEAAAVFRVEEVAERVHRLTIG